MSRLSGSVWVIGAVLLVATALAGTEQSQVQGAGASSLYGDVDHVHRLDNQLTPERIESTRQLQRATFLYDIQYDIVETPSFQEGGFVEPLVITDDGDMAGIMGTSQESEARPYIKRNGEAILGIPVSGSSFGSRVYGLNRKGTAIGQYSESPGSPMIGYIGTQQNGAKLLDFRAKCLNESGQIVGSKTTDNKLEAILLNRDKEVTLSPLPGMPQAIASSINNAGYIVGASGDIDMNKSPGVSKVQPTLWNDKGEPSALPVPPFCDDVRAVAINNGSLIALYARLGENHTKIFVVDLQEKSLVEIPELNTDIIVVSRLNDNGEIVGYTTQMESDVLHAWLYKNGQTYDLADLIPRGSELVPKAAMWINNKGQIVGLATTKTGKDVGFLMTPHRTN